MAIVLISSTPELKQIGVLTSLAGAALALRATFTAVSRRQAERRMLIAIQAMDHPGVLADARATCDFTYCRG